MYLSARNLTQVRDLPFFLPHPSFEYLHTTTTSLTLWDYFFFWIIFTTTGSHVSSSSYKRHNIDNGLKENIVMPRSGRASAGTIGSSSKSSSVKGTTGATTPTLGTSNAKSTDIPSRKKTSTPKGPKVGWGILKDVERGNLVTLFDCFACHFDGNI